MIFDGSSSRSNMDFPAVSAGAVAVRWTPVSPSDAFSLREFESFSGITLANYEVSLNPAAVAAYDSAAEEGYPTSTDGKEVLSPADGKDAKEVALAPPSPYLPGALGFPPNLDRRRVPPLSE
jgi:hypothetical protein